MNNQTPQKILLIGDGHDATASLANILEASAHRVEISSSLPIAMRRRDWRDVLVVVVDSRSLACPANEEVLALLRSTVPAPIIVVPHRLTAECPAAVVRKIANEYSLLTVMPEDLLACVQQIADRREMNRQLAASEGRQLALSGVIPDTIVRISGAGTIQDVCNQFNSDASIWTPDLIGEDLRSVRLPRAMIEDLAYTISEALTTGVIQIFEYAIPARENKWSYEVRVVCCGADEVFAIIRDVTVHKQAVAREMQAERLSAMAQLVAGLAHESRNAFQRSQACLEILAVEVEDRPECLELVQRIERAQKHLHYLYEEVQNYAAPIKLARHVCELPLIWRDTWTHLEAERSQRCVTLREKLASADYRVSVDSNALEQVFRNVLENAIVACSEPGIITIACRPALLTGHDAIEIRICDNGPGFDAATAKSVFEPFFTTKTKGTGLGLAIARRLVEAHGGTIRIGEVSTSGAEIVITLPRGRG